MSNFDYDPSNSSGVGGGVARDEEPIYLSSSDEDENMPRYTDSAVNLNTSGDDTEPISDEDESNGRMNQDDDDDEDSYIPTTKSSLASSHNNNHNNSEDESSSDMDYDGPSSGSGSGGMRRPIKVYDEYDPENLDIDDDEASPNAKYRPLRRSGMGTVNQKVRSSLFPSISYQVSQ